MKQIMTVLGKIPPAQLGFCQCHEHLYIAPGQSARVHPQLCIDDPDLSAQELAAYRAWGGRAIVDAQPVGCGRDAAALCEISVRSGVHIIASTGFHKMGFYPGNHWIFEWDEDDLANLFIRELTQGMFDLCDDISPVRQLGCIAGQIKAALDAGPMDAQYKKLFAAAAKAAKQAGAVLMVHIEKGSDPISLSSFLTSRLQPEQIIFCHMDRAVPDLEVHMQVASKGIALEYDTIGRPQYHSDQQEIDLIRALLSAGHENRLLMSLDTTRARLQSYGSSDIGLGYILRSFIPLLLQNHIPQRAIDKAFICNPARIYAVA